MGIDEGYCVVIGVKLSFNKFLDLIRKYTELDLSEYKDDDYYNIWEEIVDDMYTGIKIMDGAYTLESFVAYQYQSYFIHCAKSQTFCKNKTFGSFPSLDVDQHLIDEMQKFLESAGIDKRVSAYLINSNDV
jgi:hypothetical protein